MIRFFVRWGFRVFIVLVLLALALALLKDDLAKALIAGRIRTHTGMDVKIGKLEVGLFSPTLTIEQLKVYSTSEFGGSPFLDIPDLHIVYHPGAFARRTLRFNLVRLAVNEINIVEARDGRTNLVLALDDLEPSASSKKQGLETVAGFRFAGIDTLNLTMGKVKYTSLRRPAKATEVKLGLSNEVLTNIRSLKELRDVIVTRLFRNGITIVTDSPTATLRRKGRESAVPAARSNGKAMPVMTH